VLNRVSFACLKHTDSFATKLLKSFFIQNFPFFF
jgi:hypothetical protein